MIKDTTKDAKSVGQKNDTDRGMIIKDINYYMDLPYSIEVKRIKENGEIYYFAKVLELPGCHTDAPTAAEVLEEIEEVKRMYLEIKLENGSEIPEPLNSEDLPSGKALVRMPRTLHAQLIKDADLEKVSLNQYIVYKLSK